MGRNAKQATCRVQSCCFAPCYFAWHLSPPEEAPPPALLLLHRSREDASPVLRQTRVTDAPPRVTVATRMPPNSFAKLPIPTPDAAAGKEESALPVPLKTRVKTASTPRVTVATRIQPNSFAKQPLQSPTPAMTGTLRRRAWSRLVSKGTLNVVAKPAQKSAGTHGARTTAAMAITQHVFWTTLSRAQSTFTHDASAMWR